MVNITTRTTRNTHVNTLYKWYFLIYRLMSKYDFVFKKIHKLLFDLLIIFIPVNLAKHFILSSSYVDGVLVDYLIPSIYLTDLVILLLLVSWLLENLLSYNKNMSKIILDKKVVILFVFLIFSTKSPISFVRFLKIVEFSLLAFYVYKNFTFKKDFEKLVTLLSISVIFECVLGFIQFIKRSSLFTNYLFFGEQPYSYNTPGINIESFFGSKMIPPYGTFSHPNVFSGFLVFALTLIFYFSLTKRVKFLNVCAFFYGFFILLLTKSFVSYSALVFGVVLLGVWFFKKNTNMVAWSKILLKSFYAVLAINLLLFLIPKVEFFNSFSSVFRRVDLISASIQMFLKNPVFGVGLGLFTKNLLAFGGVRGVILFIQPVHNIYYLLLSECGLPALVLFLLLIRQLFRKIENFTIFSVVLLELLLIGTMDHYLFTLEQGMVIFWLTLGFVLSTIRKDEKSLARS